MSVWNVMKGKISDAISRVVRIDASTHAMNTITYPHHEIHGGSGFVIRGVYDIPGNGDVYDIQIQTPNTAKLLHMTLEFECENETEFEMFTGVEILSLGSTLVAGNRNLTSTKTSGATFTGIWTTNVDTAETVNHTTGSSVRLAHGIIGSGNKIGGSSHSEEEVILASNSDLCVRFIATAAGYVNYKLDWYEHTDKD